ncbi:hypothetical protein [Vibrio sp.]|uniref:hypothetical protein n=1 Tax=Vibrio sp. TaxID=678 RepID=UPI003AA9CDAB
MVVAFALLIFITFISFDTAFTSIFDTTKRILSTYSAGILTVEKMKLGCKVDCILLGMVGFWSPFVGMFIARVSKVVQYASSSVQLLSFRRCYTYLDGYLWWHLRSGCE